MRMICNVNFHEIYLGIPMVMQNDHKKVLFTTFHYYGIPHLQMIIDQNKFCTENEILDIKQA